MTTEPRWDRGQVHERGTDPGEASTPVDSPRGPFRTHVDVALVVEAAALRPTEIERVERQMADLVVGIEARLAGLERPLTMRVRLITYGSAIVDTGSVRSSAFMGPRDQLRNLPDFLETGRPPVDPVAAVRALEDAFSSDWCEHDGSRRHVVAVWAANAPVVSEESAAELAARWVEASDRSARRLVLFAPEAGLWEIMQEWENMLHVTGVAGEHLDASLMEEVIDPLLLSI